MLNETGEFYEDEGDKGELVEMIERKAKTLDSLDGLAGKTIPALEMKCLECKGHKRMDYIVFYRAPWYLRLIGRQTIQRKETDVLCRRCGGTGLEKLSPSATSQNAAAEA
jgi:hypothetical protein